MWSFRLVACIFGCALLPLTAIVTWRLSGRFAAVFATALVSANFFLIDFSANARGYILQCTLLVVSFYLVYLLKNKPNFLISILIGVVFALNLYTVPSVLIIITPLGFFYAVYSLLPVTRKRSPSAIKNTIFIAITTGVCTVALYSPVIYKKGLDGLVGIDHRDFEALINKIPMHFSHDFWTYISQGQPLVLSFLVLSAAAYGLFSLWKSNRYLFGMFLSMIIGPSIMSFVMRTVPPSRTLLPLMPIYLCLAGIGFGVLFRNTYKLLPTPTILAATILCGFIFYSGATVYSTELTSSITKEQDSGPEAFAKVLEEHMQSGDIVASAGNPIERVNYYLFTAGHTSSLIEASWSLALFEVRKKTHNPSDEPRENKTVFFFQTPKNATTKTREILKKRKQLTLESKDLVRKGSFNVPIQHYVPIKD